MWKKPFYQDDVLKLSCDLQNRYKDGDLICKEPTHGLLLFAPEWLYNEGEKDRGQRIDLVSENWRVRLSARYTRK